ncbi:MAG TPA: hypothetical protein DCM28_02795 [Phycisphaerales bacterium]|nr:hypothetical protein [Phycisphaerales bacterium]HCD34531.1 hypothetical protein [Phycisphaerales bacterium]|tara:strand:+ start:423 stop:830 length:408 start_codon:yes stop_codon:yes gene_type:complete
MTLSNYAEDAILNALFGKTSDFGALGSAPSMYVGLSTADPGEDGSSDAPPSGDGYARVSTAASDWNAASSGSLDNANIIQFPEATGSWGTITHFTIYDAPTGGNLIFSGALDTPKAFISGDTPLFAAGDLSFTAN